VDSARDIATGELIPARVAVSRRAYRCPYCRQRVTVVRESLESNRPRYFAHAKGVADPNCELYFAPSFRYSGRALAYDYQGDADRLRYEHLELSIGPNGPILALCLPPVGIKGWTGALEFSAARVSRRINWHALKYGQRIEFSLFDGMWNLIPDGVVSADYLECVQLGSRSLESGANLFYVERGAGRRVLPAESISCGESIRWLSRQSFYIPAELREVIRVDCEYQANGWTLNRLTIPQQLSVDQTRVLTEWLQRRVSERRVRVWVERPWSQGHSPQGLAIYPISAVLTVCADQPVDIQVRSLVTSRIHAEAAESTRLEFEVGEEGTMEVLVNDHHYEFFHVGSTSTPINAMVRFAGADFTDISAAQRSLDTVIAAGREKCPVLLNVGHSAVLALVTTREASVESDDRVLKTELRPGSALALDKLGELRWPQPPLSVEPVSTSVVQRTPTVAMKERARWLRSLSSATGDPSAIRIRLPSGLIDEQTFAPLSTLSWSIHLAPHVRQLQRDLESLFP
jgi:hypothetical protein